MLDQHIKVVLLKARSIVWHAKPPKLRVGFVEPAQRIALSGNLARPTHHDFHGTQDQDQAQQDGREPLQRLSEDSTHGLIVSRSEPAFQVPHLAWRESARFGWIGGEDSLWELPDPYHDRMRSPALAAMHGHFGSKNARGVSAVGDGSNFERPARFTGRAVVVAPGGVWWFLRVAVRWACGPR